MLVLDHPFRNQGIDRGFRQAGRNAAPRSISGAIIDTRGPIGADVGQKLLTKAVKPGGGKIAPPPKLVHILDNLFKHANRDLPMPELPFQRLDFLVDDREGPAKDRSRADNMVGDLLHGPFIAKWNQSIICVVGFGSAFGKRFMISAPSERMVTSPCPDYPSN